MRELSGVYGKRSDIDTAKKELSALWNNKNLAKKDFIKFAEQYCTLARLADYEDKIHVDKLTLVIPQEFCNAIVMYKVEGRLPNNWDAYLKLLLKAFKTLHSNHTKGSIFGTGSSNGKGKDPNAMEVDLAKKTKGKGKENEKSLPSKSLSSPSKDKKGDKQNCTQFKAHINKLQKQFTKLMEEGYDLSNSNAGPLTSTK
ncbi:hypothetical protein AX16_008556 [Volvariella volvacea WC 439]|nr:hypothetical protein AX16_008556 [Volvariella volvacea WC 439]